MASPKMKNHIVGGYVLLPFIGGSTQLGHIVRVTRAGSVKVRAYFRSRGEWARGLRTFHPTEMDALPASARTDEPPPPAIE